MSSRFGLAIVAALALSGAARAQDVFNGRHLAERWCSTCHATATRGSDTVRSFEAIAASAAGEQARLRRFLADPHPPMPPMQLSHTDIEDLVAYIDSLRPR